MITKSYSASCHIDKKGENDYRINCEVNSDGKTATAKYTGDSFTTGINQVMDSVIEQISKPAAEVEPEKRIKELEAQLEAEKKKNENLNKLLYGDYSFKVNYSNAVDKAKTTSTTTNTKTNNLKNAKTNDLDAFIDSIFDDYQDKYLKQYKDLFKKYFG